jgi:hypothetical protein
MPFHDGTFLFLWTPLEFLYQGEGCLAFATLRHTSPMEILQFLRWTTGESKTELEPNYLENGLVVQSFPKQSNRNCSPVLLRNQKLIQKEVSF